MDVLLLARIQFALTIMFHYLFPPLSIGLGLVMVFTEWRWLVTKDELFGRMAKFWTKIFAANFALGVATGIVMEFQFGTNWAVYSHYVGDVFGSALAAEGIFAFFLESGFLAILVFGWNRVGPRMHFFATLMVFFGSVFSAVWIVIANSWQQTPAGHHIVEHVNGFRAEIVDFWAMVFNPSSMHRLIHTVLGAFVLGAFFVLSISAWYMLKNKHLDVARKSFRFGLNIGIASLIAIIISGHFQADKVSKTQPPKLAAFEAHYKTGPGDLWLFGVPDAENQEVNFGLKIPGGLSFLLHQDFTTEVTGLDQFPPEDRPPVLIPFLTYHVMVGAGFYMLGLAVLGYYFQWRKTLTEARWLLWVFVGSVVVPYLANQTGWIAAEVGRQPWAVYGLLRTKDALSQSVTAEQTLFSIIGFGAIYILLFIVWIYVLNDKIQHGPDEPAGPAGASSGKSLLDAASVLAVPSSGHSLTEKERN